MKLFLLLLSIVSFQAWSQDPEVYLNAFDAKIYSLKTKGIKDFVVDIESSKLTKQLNEQMIFGKVDKVIFRTYWTLSPERMAIEIIGLPEGFKEIKEDLKLSVFSIMDNLIPLPTVKRFAGYKFHSGSSPKEFVAQDVSGIAPVQSYIFRFDNQDKMMEVVGKKTIGSLVIQPKYEKEGFSDGKWVLKSMVTTSSENGQTLIMRKELSYGSSQGIGVLVRISMETEQQVANKGAKSPILGETFEFKNYKINSGEALKYFLGDGTKTTP